jgi:hypothetical protein
MFRSALFAARLFRAGMFGYAQADIVLPTPSNGTWLRLPRDSEAWIRIPRST